MDTKGLQLEFISWCKSKKKSPKTEEETKQLFHAFMKEKHPKEYEAAMKQQLQNQTQKAAHGAKLQYFRTLKHQCADDEELYYYKKGGSIGCGCKKKEDGGEVKTEKNCGGGAVAKFKATKMLNAGKVRTKAEQSRIDKQSEEDAINGTYGLSKEQINKRNNPKQKTETYSTESYNKNSDKIRRTITYNSEKNDTSFYNINGKTGKVSFSSSNYGDRNLYKKDTGRFNSSKEKAPIKKKEFGGIINKFKSGGQPLYKRRDVHIEPYEERVLWRTLPDLFGRILSQLRIVRPQPNNTFNNDTIYREGFYNPSLNQNINWNPSNGNVFKYLERKSGRK